MTNPVLTHMENTWDYSSKFRQPQKPANLQSPVSRNQTTPMANLFDDESITSEHFDAGTAIGLSHRWIVTDGHGSMVSFAVAEVRTSTQKLVYRRDFQPVVVWSEPLGSVNTLEGMRGWLASINPGLSEACVASMTAMEITFLWLLSYGREHLHWKELQGGVRLINVKEWLDKLTGPRAAFGAESGNPTVVQKPPLDGVRVLRNHYETRCTDPPFDAGRVVGGERSDGGWWASYKDEHGNRMWASAHITWRLGDHDMFTDVGGVVAGQSFDIKGN